MCPRIDVLANGVPALLGVPSDLVDAGSEALKELHERKMLEGQDQCHFSSARSLLNCVLTKSHPGHRYQPWDRLPELQATDAPWR